MLENKNKISDEYHEIDDPMYMSQEEIDEWLKNWKTQVKTIENNGEEQDHINEANRLFAEAQTQDEDLLIFSQHYTD